LSLQKCDAIFSVAAFWQKIDPILHAILIELWLRKKSHWKKLTQKVNER